MATVHKKSSAHRNHNCCHLPAEKLKLEQVSKEPNPKDFIVEFPVSLNTWLAFLDLEEIVSRGLGTGSSRGLILS